MPDATVCRELCDLLDKGSLGSPFGECVLVGKGVLFCLCGVVEGDTGGCILR